MSGYDRFCPIAGKNPGEGNLGRMIFSDHDIREAVKVGKDWDRAFLMRRCCSPSSYDMHLMDKVRVFDGYETAVIDVKVRGRCCRGK